MQSGLQQGSTEDIFATTSRTQSTSSASSYNKANQNDHQSMQLKLLQIQRNSNNVPQQSSTSPHHHHYSEQQPQQQSAIMAPLPPPQQTTVIIRKDILSFNFSDIEVSEAPPSASILNEFERRSRNGELLHDLSQRAVTATPKPPITELDDIFISVKTTKNYHDTRLALIIKTWFQLARDQVSLDLFAFLYRYIFL